VTIRGDVGAYDSNGNLVTLDETLIQAEITKLQTEYDSQQYQRDRAEAYPSIVDQLDDIYHNGLAGWKANIKTIKNEYPKG
jgi:hypothetical protein